MVHNAGRTVRGGVMETDLKVEEDLMRLNYTAPVIITKAVLPAMIQRKSGYIVVVSSLQGKMGTLQLLHRHLYHQQLTSILSSWDAFYAHRTAFPISIRGLQACPSRLL